MITTVQKLIDTVDIKKKAVIQLEADLMTLRRQSLPDWKKGIEKDDRVAVKLVLVEYNKVKAELEGLLNSGVMIDE